MRSFPSRLLLQEAEGGLRRVFGRVVSGFEHVETIGKLPTDEKDRPVSRVVIAHCGELELRRLAAKKAPSPSPQTPGSPPRRKHKGRSRSPSEEKRPRKEKRKREKVKGSREETEAELDARCVH